MLFRSGRVAQWGSAGRSIILARSRELVVQNHAAFCRLHPELQDRTGVYCAGLGLKEYDKDIVFASIQSVSKKGDLFSPRKLVVIDEAYFGFGAETAVPLVAGYDNLVVTRSLSKSHGLAGLRVGYAIAQAELIEGLNRVKDSFNSYPLDAVAQSAATAAIEDRQWLEAASQSVRDVREVMSTGLEAMGFEVLPSQANFIFIQHKTLHGKHIFDALRSRDILGRRWDKQRIKNWLRVSVGTMAQAETLGPIPGG